jgi:methyltransferase family protein
MSHGIVRPAQFEELPSLIKPTDVVLDVGGGIRPLSRADYVLDFLSWSERYTVQPWLNNVWPREHFSKDTWIQWDVCSRHPWPFRDKQFDFVTCKGTLEDLRDPVWVCEEMMRVSKSGYIETPSRVIESMLGTERTRYCGYSHHHWMCELTDKGIVFTFKHAQMHVYRRFHLSAGPEPSHSRRDHSPLEVFDVLERLATTVKRWFYRVNPKYSTIGLYWKNEFDCKEKVLVDKGEVEADLMRFKERCRLLDDLWVPKRTWYGKRLQP